jgi:hypothetical protein
MPVPFDTTGFPMTIIKTPINMAYQHPTDNWIVRAFGTPFDPKYQLWFYEAGEWRDTGHGDFASCADAVLFAEGL